MHVQKKSVSFVSFEHIKRTNQEHDKHETEDGWNELVFVARATDPALPDSLITGLPPAGIEHTS